MLSINTQGQNKPLVSFKAYALDNGKYPEVAETLIKKGWSLLVKKPDRPVDIDSDIYPFLDYSLNNKYARQVIDRLELKGIKNIIFDPKETEALSEVSTHLKNARNALEQWEEEKDKPDIVRTIEDYQKKITTFLIGKIEVASTIPEGTVSTANQVSCQVREGAEKTCWNLIKDLFKAKN